MKLQYRLAKIKDVDSLLRIENSLFKTDRLSKKSFVHFVRSDKSDLYVALIHNTIVGYYLLLYNRGTSLARLYSIAISKRHQGKGYGEALLMHAEKTASANRKNILRLEVRPDNPNAIRLYEKMGYRKYDVKKAFYEDKTPAFCFEKKILPSHLGFRFKIPYFQQNTPFTCGPASLIMAMSSHDKNVTPSLELELDIWREATTIFMTSGHGGCGPRGLALSAQKRGFLSEVWVSKKGPLFTNGVRTEDKKNIMRIVHHKFENEIMKSKTPFHVKRITLKDLDQAMKKNGIPIVLISAYKIVKTKTPHWVVIAGYDENYFYIHDPDLDPSSKRHILDVSYFPVKKDEFLKMARYGKHREQAVVIVYPKKTK